MAIHNLRATQTSPLSSSSSHLANPRQSSAHLFLLVLAGALCLLRTSELLRSVLSLLALLSAGFFDLGGLADSDESVTGLELLHGLDGIVDQGETGCLATSVLCA